MDEMKKVELHSFSQRANFPMVNMTAQCGTVAMANSITTAALVPVAEGTPDFLRNKWE